MAGMSDLALNDQKFPVGTSVSVYPQASFVGGSTPVAAPGTGVAAVETKVVQANGVVTFTGLVDGTKYAAYAQVNGENRWIEFIKGSVFTYPLKWAAKVAARRAAIGTS